MQSVVEIYQQDPGYNTDYEQSRHTVYPQRQTLVAVRYSSSAIRDKIEKLKPTKSWFIDRDVQVYFFENPKRLFEVKEINDEYTLREYIPTELRYGLKVNRCYLEQCGPTIVMQDGDPDEPQHWLRQIGEGKAEETSVTNHTAKAGSYQIRWKKTYKSITVVASEPKAPEVRKEGFCFDTWSYGKVDDSSYQIYLEGLTPHVRTKNTSRVRLHIDSILKKNYYLKIH